jgi:hypothetical protein
MAAQRSSEVEVTIAAINDFSFTEFQEVYPSEIKFS